MESEWRYVNHVSFFRDDHGLSFDRVLDFTRHNQPEFRAFGMIMSAIFGVIRRTILFIAIYNVRYRAVVMDEALSGIFVASVFGELVQVDVRLVSMIVRRGSPVERDGYEVDAGDLRRLLVSGIKSVGLRCLLRNARTADRPPFPLRRESALELRTIDP